MLFIQGGYLNGALLYLEPEHRGRGLCGAYFDAVTALARQEGLRGFQFLSTLPKWRREEYPFDCTVYLTQGDGTIVYRYRREA